MDGSYDHNELGIENPTSSHDAPSTTTRINTRRSRICSYILDDTSRVSFMGSASYSDFQVPNTPGLPAGTSPDGSTRGTRRQRAAGSFNSAGLNENQNEQNYYGVVDLSKDRRAI